MLVSANRWASCFSGPDISNEKLTCIWKQKIAYTFQQQYKLKCIAQHEKKQQ